MVPRQRRGTRRSRPSLASSARVRSIAFRLSSSDLISQTSSALQRRATAASASGRQSPALRIASPTLSATGHLLCQMKAQRVHIGVRVAPAAADVAGDVVHVDSLFAATQDLVPEYPVDSVRSVEVKRIPRVGWRARYARPPRSGVRLSLSAAPGL